LKEIIYFPGSDAKEIATVRMYVKIIEWMTVETINSLFLENISLLKFSWRS